MPKAGIKYGKRVPGPKEGYETLTQAAKDDVARTLAFVARPEDLVVRAAEVVRQADAEIALHVDDRDQALAHL